VVEALKRRDDEPRDLRPSDLMVVSLGTGSHEVGHGQSEVKGWGRLGWIWPRDGDPALISAFLDGQSDAAHHWAEILLNHEPGRAVADPATQGTGPRSFRSQTRLPERRALESAGDEALEGLSAAAARLLADADPELREVAGRLASKPALPPDPPDGQRA